MLQKQTDENLWTSQTGMPFRQHHPSPGMLKIMMKCFPKSNINHFMNSPFKVSLRVLLHSRVIKSQRKGLRSLSAPPMKQEITQSPPILTLLGLGSRFADIFPYLISLRIPQGFSSGPLVSTVPAFMPRSSLACGHE